MKPLGRDARAAGGQWSISFGSYPLQHIFSRWSLSSLVAPWGSRRRPSGSTRGQGLTPACVALDHPRCSSNREIMWWEVVCSVSFSGLFSVTQGFLDRWSVFPPQAALLVVLHAIVTSATFQFLFPSQCLKQTTVCVCSTRLYRWLQMETLADFTHNLFGSLEL